MWLGERNYWEMQSLAEGTWPFIRFQLLPAWTLIAALGLFDRLTRKRLRPAYVLAGLACLPIPLLAGWLYFQPFWQPIALHLIGP